MILSESATRLLEELKTPPELGLCPACARTRLGLEHWDVLKLVRELIGAGLVLCVFDVCPVCGQRDLVTILRRHRARGDHQAAVAAIAVARFPPDRSTRAPG